jgi:phospholipid/cholesterol/gamma-HCH transport system permease protein
MPERRSDKLYGIVSALGRILLGFLEFVGGLWLLLKDTLIAAFRRSGRRATVGGNSFWAQSVRAGPRAIPVVFLVNFFIGIILALIGGKVLSDLGVSHFIGDLLGVGIVLELGPLLTGIIMTGYIGAALAAEIATMVVSEEITALRTMGLNPIRFIVAPRLLAVTVMVPCVTLLGDAVGIFGGSLVADQVLDISGNAFYERAWASLAPEDVWRGLIKATVFGLLIGTIGCFQGFRVAGGAEGVGRVTTQAVVTSIISIIVIDAILNYLLLFRL